MKLARLRESYSVARLPRGARLPVELFAAEGLVSLTQRGDELSVVAPEPAVAAIAEAVAEDPGWAAYEVEGPLDLALTGVMASLSDALAEAGISLFAVSTFDTDVILVKSAAAQDAVAAWRAAGHEVSE